MAYSVQTCALEYELALEIIAPLAERYSSNPLFQRARGDLYARLGRKPQALECYRAAQAASVRDADCAAHIQELVRASLAAIGTGAEPGPP